MLDGLYLLVKALGKQLSMFGEHKEVQSPGSRGGKFFYSKKEHKVRYGDQPQEAEKKPVPTPGQMVLFHSAEGEKKKGEVLASGTHGVTVKHEDGKREQVKHEQVVKVEPEKAPKSGSEEESRVQASYQNIRGLADHDYMEARLSVSKEEKSALREGGFNRAYYSPNRPLNTIGIGHLGQITGKGRFLFTKDLLPLKTVADYELAAGTSKMAGALALQHYQAVYGHKPVVLFKNTEDLGRGPHGVIISPSAKRPNKFQYSYFDENGFAGDEQFDTEEDAVADALMGGYRTFGPDEFDELASTEKFQEGSHQTLERQWAANRKEEYKQLGTKAPRFKAWFGNWEKDPANASKVVNAKGEPQETYPLPKVVYHGTDTEFDQFNKDTVGENFKGFSFGFHFSSSEEEANKYGSRKIIKAYLCIKNPLIIQTGQQNPSAYVDSDRANLIHQVVTSRRTEKAYDGIIATDDKGDSNYVVFEPTQIKAVDNRGTFDPKDPNMNKARGLFLLVKARVKAHELKLTRLLPPHGGQEQG